MTRIVCVSVQRQRYICNLTRQSTTDMRKGTRIVQADSGTDPDSENWRRSPRRLPTGWDCRVSADKVQCVDPPEDHTFLWPLSP